MPTIKQDIQALVKKSFPQIKTEEDLLCLLNKINALHYQYYYAPQSKSVPPIKLSTLKYYKNLKLSGEKRYTTFTIKKKSGKDREISAPAKGLKLIQECLNEIFQTFYETNEHACGFIPGRNVTDGAKKHTNKPYVFNIDLKDFFDTITFPRVKKVLMLPPFNLNGEREPLAYVIASLCCHPKNDKERPEVIHHCLPQGAPTSPILTNIICRKLDRHLAGLAHRFQAEYSRYADDISFSCYYNIFKTDSEFCKELVRIIEDEQGLTINKEKTRLQTSHQRQEVTGLVVNRKVNVTKRYVKKIRLWLHYWECFGYERAQKYFVEQYTKERGNAKRHASKALIENVIAGKLDYMRMVVGESNPMYKSLNKRYIELTSVEPKTKAHKSDSPKKPITHIADSTGIQPIPKAQPPVVPKENLEVLLDGLISDLRQEKLSQILETK